MNPTRSEESESVAAARPWFFCCRIPAPVAAWRVAALHLTARVLELPSNVDRQPGDVSLLRAFPLRHKTLMIDAAGLAHDHAAGFRCSCKRERHLALGVLVGVGLPACRVVVVVWTRMARS